jgi:polyhydroxybutyrate depolymerase
MKTRLRTALFCILVQAFGCGAALAEGYDLRVPYDGVERLVWVTDSRLDTTKPAPLVLALHGYRKPAETDGLYANPQSLAWPELQKLTDVDEAIVLYPLAYKGQWALFDGLPNTETPDGIPVHDEGFLLDLVGSFVAKGAADPARLYITGVSDGAIMTYRMICVSDTPFAAAAALIGSAYGGHIEDCHPEVPPALMHVHGTDDRVLPYEGWIFPSGREASVPEVMEHFRRLHGCTGQEGQMLEDLDPEDGSTVGEMTWTGCKRSGAVKRYKVIGGGHDVPDANADQRPDGKRKFNRDMDTAAIMWRFFLANPRPM